MIRAIRIGDASFRLQSYTETELSSFWRIFLSLSGLEIVILTISSPLSDKKIVILTISV